MDVKHQKLIAFSENRLNRSSTSVNNCKIPIANPNYSGHYRIQHIEFTNKINFANDSCKLYFTLRIVTNVSDVTSTVSIDGSYTENTNARNSSAFLVSILNSYISPLKTAAGVNMTISALTSQKLSVAASNGANTFLFATISVANLSTGQYSAGPLLGLSANADFTFNSGSTTFPQCFDLIQPKGVYIVINKHVNVIDVSNFNSATYFIPLLKNFGSVEYIDYNSSIAPTFELKRNAPFLEIEFRHPLTFALMNMGESEFVISFVPIPPPATFSC